MNNPETSSDSSAPGQPFEAIPAASTVKDLNRRRLLLKGAASTGATVAALQPIGALATIPSGSTVLTCPSSVAGAKETNCTVSGVQSAAHSFASNITKIPAGGKAISYWSATTNGVPNKRWNCSTLTKVSALFPYCNSTYSNKTLLDMLKNYSGTTEAGYICAYLNGTNFYSDPPTNIKCFPYSAAQVQTYWNDTKKRASALALFQRISTQTT